MKHTSLCIVAAVALFAAAATAGAKTPTLATDLSATLGAAVMGGVAVNAEVELPLARAWSLDIEPSFSIASSPGLLTTQTAVRTTARYYFSELFGGHQEPFIDTGLYAGLGAAVAWAYMNGGTPLSLLSVGPAVQAGYRFAFGGTGFFLEPYAGWMALFGASLSGGSGAVSQGLYGGLSLGWRF